MKIFIGLVILLFLCSNNSYARSVDNKILQRFSPQARSRLLCALAEIYKTMREDDHQSQFEEFLLLEEDLGDGVHRDYLKKNRERYNFRLPSVGCPVEKSHLDSENNIPSHIPSAFTRPGRLPGADINIQKLESDLISYELRSLGFSEKALDALLTSNLTYDEQYQFITTPDFMSLDFLLQEKIIKTPSIINNQELFALIQSFAKITPGLFKGPKAFRPNFDTYIDYDEAPCFGSDSSMRLTPAGIKRIKECALETIMAVHNASPFVKKRNKFLRFFGLRNYPLQGIRQEDFLDMALLSQATASTRAEILLAAKQGDIVRVLASGVSNRAVELRLELLQQACLYQHAEFRSLVQAFPEHDIFVYVLGARAGRSLKGIEHLAKVMIYDSMGSQGRTLLSYFRFLSSRIRLNAEELRYL